ncbi:hypothetical protein [Pseudomonas sp. IT-P4]|uniref:hypothetical protein n=1 Tax=Pseudomonas sp. IT-P4 TaxID=3026446 RepID=UPI0039E09B30
MVKSRSAGVSPIPEMPPPEINGLLPEVPGGETNLLPEALTHTDLKVWFTVPLNSHPEVAEETVKLFVDGSQDALVTRRWNQPIEDSDRYLEVPQAWLRNNDGEHLFHYRVTIFNGSSADSFDLPMTLDTQPPLLVTGSTLNFPSEVLPPNPLTARYLEQNNDEVKAGLPDYTSPRPWDRITWYWGLTPNTQEQGGVIELDDTNFSEPLFITIAGQLIRDRGDGFRYVWYQVQDRAGNQSYRSDVVELDVAATPIPRNLPWPAIERAAGSGELQTLDPLLASTGGVVEVPNDAVIYPGEGIRVQWGEPGELGHWIADQAITPGQLRFSIPMKSVAAYIGKALWVSYGVMDDAGKEWPSMRRKLQVVNLSGLPTVQCNGLSGGSLSLRTVAATGAILKLNKWPLMTTDQWILLTMTGVGSGGQDSVFEVIRKRALTDQEVIGGIGGQNNVTVDKAFLNTLRRNAPLTGKVYVSFDGGRTWPPTAAPNFPLLQLTLID